MTAHVRPSLHLLRWVPLATLVISAAWMWPAAAEGDRVARPVYQFTDVADSVDDGLDPFSFGCASINNPGDIAFRAGRMADDGFNTTDGIYRANASGQGLITIVEDEERFGFLGNNPSMNDSGEVSFAAGLESGGEAVLRGDGAALTTIAVTKGRRFNFFGFDTSINNRGRVAFKAELDERYDFDEGLFSGRGGRVSTHYLASASQFDGTDTRPSINNVGEIAFEDSIDFTSGIFVTDPPGFRTIAAPDPDRSVQEPMLNDMGAAAFEISFVDETTDEFVTAIVKGRGGPLRTVADTRGDFEFFGFRPPSINDSGAVAYLATLSDFVTQRIFVDRGAFTDQVIATGDVLDGSPVQNIVFCEEGLNDSGQLTFVATLEDASTPDGFRVAVFRATPTWPSMSGD